MKLIAIASVLVLTAGSALASNDLGSGMVVLNPTAPGALSMTGNSKIYVPTKAVYVNSSASQAVKTTGSATLDTPLLKVVGGTAFNGQSMATGAVHSPSTPVEDPLFHFAIPNNPGINRGAMSISGGTHVLQPGYYPSGIQINGNADITLSPGIYQVAGGFKFNSGRLIGEGVTIILLSGQLDLGGNCEILLTPSTTGPCAGVVIAQAFTNTTDIKLAGGSDVLVSGAIYGPSAKLIMVGNSTVEGEGPTLGDLVVVDMVELKGTAVIRIGGDDRQAIVPMTQPLYD